MCDFCNKFDFGSASIDVDKYGARVKLALAAYRYPREEQFNFCPKCGKSRGVIETEKKSEKIQKGEPIWYVDFESGEIEQGTIFGVKFINERLDSFSVDFGYDFDEFLGDAIGRNFFLSKEDADAALRRTETL